MKDEALGSELLDFIFSRRLLRHCGAIEEGGVYTRNGLFA